MVLLNRLHPTNILDTDNLNKFDQNATVPNTPDNLSSVFQRVELTLSMCIVISKLPLKPLTIGQINLSKPCFYVMRQLSFIPLPIIFNTLVKISVIKVSVQLLRTVIVDFTFPMKFVLIPLPFICYFAIVIEQFSETVHWIVLPATFIVPSILVKELSLSVSQTVEHISTVTTSVLVLLLYVLERWIIGLKLFGYFFQV